jgi:isopentenyldiphosphate isomerase
MTHRRPTLPASDASVYGAASSPRADDAELLSLVDASGRPLPCSAPRAMVHRAGLWHRSFHCWLVRLGPQGLVLLLQRRAWAKATWPGAWDVSAAGHYLAGEGLAGGCREIAEELGIRVEASALTWLGRHREVVRYASGLRDREYQDVYVLYDDRPLGAYAPDPEEVIGLALVEAGAPPSPPERCAGCGSPRACGTARGGRNGAGPSRGTPWSLGSAAIIAGSLAVRRACCAPGRYRRGGNEERAPGASAPPMNEPAIAAGTRMSGWPSRSASIAPIKAPTMAPSKPAQPPTRGRSFLPGVSGHGAPSRDRFLTIMARGVAAREG